MFADPNNLSSIGPSLIAAIGAVIVAVISAGAAIWSNIKSNRINRDLEHLKAKLAHGQLIGSTQWNAEFCAYQELWKSVVPVRVLAYKIVKREGELPEVGIEPGDVSEEAKIANTKDLLPRYSQASNSCMAAINEHAPFYAANIREKANEVHILAHAIFKANLAAQVARMKGKSLPIEQATIADIERQKELSDLMLRTNQLEEMIRKRMSEVKVVNPMLG